MPFCDKLLCLASDIACDGQLETAGKGVGVIYREGH